jgi:D-glycero-alpha-D-manno-heptose 1-phosphate guanylyltransferase
MRLPSILPAQCDVFILAGGKATRLQPIVNDRPKILADVCGRPFAHYLLAQLERAGFRRAVICTGHMADMVEIALGSRWKTMELIYSREETAMDTAGALRLALQKFRTEHCVVVNGDTFVNVDFADLLRCYSAAEAVAAIVVAAVRDPQRYGSIVISPTGLVTGFREKARTAPASISPDLINAGVYVLSRPLIDRIPVAQKVSIERDMMPLWVDMGVLAYKSAGPFIDIGTPSSYAEAQHLLAEWADIG